MRRLLATLAVASVVFMSGCKKDEYLAKVGVCPVVVSTIPVNGAVGVPLNQVISITFNEKMNPATFTSESFVLQGTAVIAGAKAATVVTGAFTFNDKTAIFTPSSPLAANTTYTGTVKTAVKDLTGNALQINYVWSFTTGIPPTVTATDPLNNAISVVLNKVITATFSVPMDPLTITATSVTVKQGTTAIAGTVTYTGTTASFTPSAPFAANTVYTGTISTIASNTTGIALASNYVWTFNTGVSPTVISTDPLNNAIGVSLNKAVAATFSVPMDPLTFSTTTFNLKQGSSAIAGAVTFSGSTAVFTPTIAFTPNTVYTATITTAVKNVAGLPIVSDYVWSFTTGISPTVISVDPANNATGVVLNKIVAATFSVPMNPLTITGATFTLKQGVTSVAGVVSYTGSTASFNPAADLLPNTIYTATITTGAKNVAGTQIVSNYVWTFTTTSAPAPTVISTDPLDLATGVALNKVIAATFSTTMDPLTITSSTFTLKQGTTSVSGAVSYSGSTASFNPTADLLPGTVYTATITTGAKNVAGTAMANDHVWSFTTLAASAQPQFSSVFGAIGGNAGVTNQGIYTVINNGSIGTTAASTLVTGLHDSTGDSYTESPLNKGDVKGRIYTDAPPPVIPATGATGGNAQTMAIAQAGLLAATNFYISISPASKPGGIVLSTDELGGRTLAPGIYKSGSSYNITSLDLTLDAQGDANAVWIFQVPSALTVGTPTGARSVKLINGALAKNVFWYVGQAAVINYAGGGTMVGTIIANSGVTLSSPGNSTNTTVQTVLNGRAISLISGVTMVNTIINVPN